jgi:hypothetical protein
MIFNPTLSKILLHLEKSKRLKFDIDRGDHFQRQNGPAIAIKRLTKI